MRWQAFAIAPEPEHWAERKRKVFAFIPHTANDGYIYWLEFIYLVEHYGTCFHHWYFEEYQSARS